MERAIHDRVNEILHKRLAMGLGSGTMVGGARKRRSSSKSRSTGSKRRSTGSKRRMMYASGSGSKRRTKKRISHKKSGKGYSLDLDHILGRGVLIGGRRRKMRKSKTHRKRRSAGSKSLSGLRRGYLTLSGARRGSKRMTGGRKMSNPWLKFLAKYRREMKREGVDMPAQKIMKEAAKAYRRMH